MTHSAGDEPYDYEKDGGIGDPVVEPTPAEPPALTEPGAVKEPLAATNVVQLLIAVGVTYGWFAADNPIIPIAATIVGGVLSLITLLVGRSKVTPL